MTARRWFDVALLASLILSTALLGVAWTQGGGGSGPCYQNSMASAQDIGCQDDSHINTLIADCSGPCKVGSGQCDYAQVDSPITIPRGAAMVTAGGNTGLQYVAYACWSHTPCNCTFVVGNGYICGAGKTTYGPNTWNPQSVNLKSPSC